MDIEQFGIYDLQLPLGERDYPGPAIVLTPQWILAEYEERRLPGNKRAIVVLPCSTRSDLCPEDRSFLISKEIDEDGFIDSGFIDPTYAIVTHIMVVRGELFEKARQRGSLEGIMREKLFEFIKSFYFDT